MITDQGDTEAQIDKNGFLTPGELEGSIQIEAKSVVDPTVKKQKTVLITEAESKLPEIKKIEEISEPRMYVCVPQPLWSTLQVPYIDSEDVGYGPPYNGKIYLFNDSKVPYVNIAEYVEFWMSGWSEYGYHDYQIEKDTENKKIIIQNLYYQGINTANCTIDFNRQKLIFDDYDRFTNETLDFLDPLACGISGGEDYFVDVVSNYQAPTQPYVIDLSKYNILAYYDENDNGYLPYYVFTNIIDREPKYNLFFNGEDFYELPCGQWDSWSTIAAYSWYEDWDQLPIFTKEYMQFCYDLLALTLDVRFGLTERPSRGRPGTTIKYFENGAYAAMEPYHDALVSLQPNTSNSAIRELFNAECDDGGHAGYSTVNLLSTTPLSGEGRGPETAYTSDIATLMSSARSSAGHNLPSESIGQIEIESTSEGANDIAWVTMDSFAYPDEDEKVEYDEVDETNYMYDTISLTMYLQKLVNASGSTIKHVVLDLTNNGGGAVCTELFMASYLCGGRNQYAQESESEKITIDNGGVTESIYNPHTNAYSQYTVYADINGDGVYDEDDCLPSDVDLWCITSNYSFSCGNMLPCNLADCSDCEFVGDRTGGGACFVDGNVNMGFGNDFRGSSTFHMLKNASTPNNLISVEEGVIPKEDYFIRNSYWNAPDFYNREYLIGLMWGE